MLAAGSVVFGRGPQPRALNGIKGATDPLPPEALPSRRVDNGKNPAECAPMQPVSSTDHARPAVPFAAATGGVLVFTTVDAIVKALPQGVPVTEIVAMCFLFAIPVALAAVWHG